MSRNVSGFCQNLGATPITTASTRTVTRYSSGALKIAPIPPATPDPGSINVATLETFQILFQNSNDPQYVLDLDTQRFMEVNASFERLTGYTRADPIASLLICVLIAVSSVRLLRESLHALMEGVPQGLSVESIGAEMAPVGGDRAQCLGCRLEQDRVDRGLVLEGDFGGWRR